MRGALVFVVLVKATSSFRVNLSPTFSPKRSSSSLSKISRRFVISEQVVSEETSEAIETIQSKSTDGGGVRLSAGLQLLGCSAMWGTYPSLMRSLYDSPGAHLDPPFVTLLRFTVMAGVAVLALVFSGKVSEVAQTSSPGDDNTASPATSPHQTTEDVMSWETQLLQRTPSSLALCAFELGLLCWLGTFLNSTGLETVSPLKAGILLSFINVFTPLVSCFAGATKEDRSVPRSIWFGSLSTLSVSAFALVPDGSDPSNPLFSAAGGAAAAAASAAAVSATATAAASVPSSSMTPPTIFFSSSGECLLLGAAFVFSSVKVRLGTHLRVHDPSNLSAARQVAQWLVALAAVAVLAEAIPLLPFSSFPPHLDDVANAPAAATATVLLQATATNEVWDSNSLMAGCDAATSSSSLSTAVLGGCFLDSSEAATITLSPLTTAVSTLSSALDLNELSRTAFDSQQLLQDNTFSPTPLATAAPAPTAAANAASPPPQLLLPSSFPGLDLSPRQGALIVGSALASGTAATWLQAKGQSVIPATEAQLIFAFTPIFSALWASLFLHEAISAHEVAGGVGLLAIAGAVATNPKAKAPPSETRERLE